MWKTDDDGRLLEMSVFADVDGEATLAGILGFQGRRGGLRQGTFRYDERWRQHRARPLFVSGLPLRKATQSLPPAEVPLPFYDACPDGWGKAILSLAYPDTPMAIPEFIATAGSDRVGSLQFGPDTSGPEVWVPTTAMLDLPQDDDQLVDLMDAAEAVENGVATRSHLTKLLDSGADIGGARPKARIRINGEGWIVKLRATGDAFDCQRVEAACLSVARLAGIETPAHEVIDVGGRSALLVKRFDRTGRVRHPYASAATVLGYPAGTYRPDDASYADLAIQARRAGITDCAQLLFERLLLNCFLNNTDDHLHNHGFIDDGKGWRLSPVFDVVPQARQSLVLRPARGTSAEANPKFALASHERFGLSRSQAEDCFERIRQAAASFPDMLERYGVADEHIAIVMRLAPHAAAASGP